VSEPTFVVLGDVMNDVVCLLRGPLVPGSDSPAPIQLTGGGSAANTAAWLAASGHRVRFVGRVGDDLAGDAAVSLLRAGGVDVHVSVDPVRPTGTCVVLVGPDGERTMVPDTGANGVWTSADLPTSWEPAGHLHISGYALVNAGARATALEAVRRARLAGATVSVDTASTGPLSEVGPREFLSWVRGVDVALANAPEASLLSGAADPADAALALRAWFSTVVVKLGASGSLLARSGSLVTAHAPAVQAEVVDSTGAGDAFAAGFLPAWCRGAPDAEALRAGNALGARAVSQPGARPSTQPGNPGMDSVPESR
jgi:sugar/nucleoside kinase (ribokinase family)